MTDAELRKKLLSGLVIPAHPLALNARRKLDERRQRALTRYYLAAGSGGIAVGVHTTQFEIHNPAIGLYQPVLQLAMEEVQRFTTATRLRPLTVAGIVGPTAQASGEAALARELGYDCGLISLGALQHASEEDLIHHTATVAEAIPIFGFYLQPAVGGRVLSYDFWRSFAEIDQVVGIKIAPFNRYQTIDVVRAVADSGRGNEIALYTGNDDNIVADLITPMRLSRGGQSETLRIVGGLLGHWAVWTSKAVKLLHEIHESISTSNTVGTDLLIRGVEITDANAALFDPRHQFAGCIAGIHEVLRRQGLLEGRWCVNPIHEQLSPGQEEEIDRIFAAYPHLRDDDFVAEHLDEWMA